MFHCGWEEEEHCASSEMGTVSAIGDIRLAFEGTWNINLVFSQANSLEPLLF